MASAFARSIAASADLNLQQICARNEMRGKALATACGASWAARPEEVAEADVYLIAVSDSAITDVASRLPRMQGAVVAHTSGGLSIDVIPDDIPDRAVLYPLQTFSHGRAIDMNEVPLFIEATTPRAAEVISRLARSLSGKVMEADSARRNRLHLAAVMASNFTNHLYFLASRLLEQDGMDLSILAPLIRETVAKALESGTPAEVQTGPAARRDGVTLRRHLELLERESDTNLIEIYKLLSKSIWETSKKI